METLTDKGEKVFKTARRSRLLAAELYRLRCEGLANTQVAQLEKGEKQQPIVLQGVMPIEVITIESSLLFYEKMAARVALMKAKRAALKVANQPELMMAGAENPIAITVAEKIQALLDETNKDDEDDEDDEDEQDAAEDVKIEVSLAAEPPAAEPPAPPPADKGETKS